MSRLPAMPERLHAFWSSRAPRERSILAAGSLLIVFLLGWVLVWRPVDDWAQAQRSELERKAQTAAIVAAARDQLVAGEEAPAGSGLPLAMAGASLSPMQQAQRQAEKLEIVDAIERREPIRDGGLHIRFDDLPYSRLIRWIKAMENAGLTVTRARMRPVDSDQPNGRVVADLDLTPANP